MIGYWAKNKLLLWQTATLIKAQHHYQESCQSNERIKRNKKWYSETDVENEKWEMGKKIVIKRKQSKGIVLEMFIFTPE